MTDNIKDILLTAKSLPKKAKIENDMITGLKICRDRGFILGLCMEFASGRQPLFCGHHNTPNLGYMMMALAEVLGINESGESHDFLCEFQNTPIRIATTEGLGIYVDTVWLGHFMKDKWVAARDIVKVGLPEE